jgi:hypothetical protein
MDHKGFKTMTKKISLPNLSILKTTEDKEKTLLTPETTTQGTEPETTTETTETPTDLPISKRMGDLMIIQMETGTRLSGIHPLSGKSLPKNHPKWMIGPKFNGRERWMDLTKITGWNIQKKQIILSLSEIQHRGYDQFIEREFNPETDTDFTIRENLK